MTPAPRPPAQAERDALNHAARVLGTLPTAIYGTRLIRGWTQHQLAVLLGVDRETVGRWESGESFPAGAAVLAGLLRWLADDGPAP